MNLIGLMGAMFLAGSLFVAGLIIGSSTTETAVLQRHAASYGVCE